MLMVVQSFESMLTSSPEPTERKAGFPVLKVQAFASV